MCVFICVYVSRLLAKRKTIQTWNLAHILPLTLSKNGFVVFSKKRPWEPLASKNCRVTWIFCIAPRLPCLLIFWSKSCGYWFFFYFWYHPNHNLVLFAGTTDKRNRGCFVEMSKMQLHLKFFAFIALKQCNEKHGNQVDVPKIDMTRQFFKYSCLFVLFMCFFFKGLCSYFRAIKALCV